MTGIIISAYFLIKTIVEFFKPPKYIEATGGITQSDLLMIILECILWTALLIISIYEYIEKRHLKDQVSYLSSKK